MWIIGGKSFGPVDKFLLAGGSGWMSGRLAAGQREHIVALRHLHALICPRLALDANSEMQQFVPDGWLVGGRFTVTIRCSRVRL